MITHSAPNSVGILQQEGPSLSHPLPYRRRSESGIMMGRWCCPCRKWEGIPWGRYWLEDTVSGTADRAREKTQQVFGLLGTVWPTDDTLFRKFRHPSHIRQRIRRQDHRGSCHCRACHHDRAVVLENERRSGVVDKRQEQVEIRCMAEAEIQREERRRKRWKSSGNIVLSKAYFN